jgi:glycosyltransferase involved in cell wall biosynthesis
VRSLRIAHLTTVDMSLELLLGTELDVDVAAGHTVFGISAPGPFVAQVQARGVTHVPIPSLTRAWRPAGDLAAGRELATALRALRLDVLHTHNPKTGVLGRVIGRALDIPAVVNTCHGLWMRPDDRLAKKAAVVAAEGLAAQCSHAELYQNAADRRLLRHWVPHGRARVVGNGIDLTRFGPDPDARARVRAELGVGDDQVLVGGVGRRVAEKGIVEFTYAARALSGRATFMWVGPADDDKSDAVGMSDGVHFVGLRDDMPAVYAAIDVFALPSYREGFSRSSMEAAASECAIVLSDIRGCREIGAHDEHVLLVPPRDPAALAAAITRLITDPPLRERLGKAAEQRARTTFDQRAIAAASLETYRAVARHKGLHW